MVEEQIKSLLGAGYELKGRLTGDLPRMGELTPDCVGTTLGISFEQPYANAQNVMPRPPALCQGCGHRDVYDALNKVAAEYPDARIFGLGVEALGFSPEEVLVVGDSYDKDIVPAHSLGCRTVWLKGQGWNTAEEDGQECCADKIIDELQEIIS